MPIDPVRLKAWPFPDIVHRYTAKDTILYALGVGYGAPTDPDELRFVYEERLVPAPTLAVVLAGPGGWTRKPESGIDWRQVLHGEQSLVIHRPLKAQGEVIGRTRIDDVIDKGEGRGALIYSSRDLIDRDSGELLCSLASTTFCRADGGFGGRNGPLRPVQEIEDRPPDLTCDLPTSPRAAVIYRLSGDDNPLHIDPAVARAAGFPRPILHGLATYGVAGRAVIRSLCGNDPARLRRLDARFSAVVYPGETIHTEIWRLADGRAAFRCRVVERDAVVLNNGRADYA